MYDNIIHMINNKSTVDMIYLDFSKAFDKVDHGILLHKLRDLGIIDRLGLWVFHLLNNRQHYVRMPGGISHNHLYTQAAKLHTRICTGWAEFTNAITIAI